jgi:hypothetical protein
VLEQIQYVVFIEEIFYSFDFVLVLSVVNKSNNLIASLVFCDCYRILLHLEILFCFLMPDSCWITAIQPSIDFDDLVQGEEHVISENYIEGFLFVHQDFFFAQLNFL